MLHRFIQQYTSIPCLHSCRFPTHHIEFPPTYGRYPNSTTMPYKHHLQFHVSRSLNQSRPNRSTPKSKSKNPQMPTGSLNARNAPLPSNQNMQTVGIIRRCRSPPREHARGVIIMKWSYQRNVVISQSVINS